ncbi:hypothetical protein CcaverHIS002_0311250 [Cutaneotrichosporon cavernicola]|uniref:Presequence protease, mitochondrial n=1 Tax=Cutaneotrichosporon cavernicola TaxID=279322 RepID=A0AA48L320_9TREE|nr:uncharacterized protein CcaverHIS019_0311110 [Cutaneotrichosporon cavernicola]BEI83257.1 hypothetical protein CcaverHIS002_0311250 [Cutaneotrichosporon cavernicola]BEI91041.1 hypothetical protein CcaverHIS019_0311110 [Cutaneotrichosporon cavernicola]BEI98820.1 hypothetical protein CcaverHIS631_0311190 [Cutaneotrichosporon cavernicola]BEJ06592.1 hypothetical protein CcaverHIS641_0311140 [Cutaneotrichosporon cavernicola]
MPSTSAYSRDYGNFKLLQSLDLKYAPVTVSKWRSEKTGLTVTLGNHSSPITNGYFVIASEIFDDTGRPHTLEHLIFLGSQRYPYKGVLDNLANRAGSNGTNAWTANDHTAYTINTAGSTGFLNVLPVFVDHILHATMTDAGFVTEIHHINSEGEDAGVVYSEMQGRENTSYDRMALELQRTLYPTTSAYRSETGGLLKALRVLTVEQIREYHGKYYVPYNLNLHIDGGVDVEALFKVLNETVEPMILENKDAQANGTFEPPAGWKRPFMETTTAKPNSITESVVKTVEFMEEDESVGELFITYLGPKPTDFLEGTALDILGSYLTYSATSPLQKEFIEIVEPYATSVYLYGESRVNAGEHVVMFGDVPTKHLNELPKLFFDKLKRIVKEEGIDMTRMASILRRERRAMLNRMETSVSSVLADVVIQDFLYGNEDGKDLPEAFDELKDFTILESWTAEQWAALLDKWYASAPSIGMIGKPSAKLAHEVEASDKKRIAEQKEKLGEDGLKKLKEKLEWAQKESDKPIPSEMLTVFPTVKPSELSWIPVETAINNAKNGNAKSDSGDVQRYIDADGVTLPYEAHFADVKSNFVSVGVLFDTAKLPQELMPYMALLQVCLFNLGIKRPDGTELNYEEVINQLNDFTVSSGSKFSVRSCFSEAFSVFIKAEKSQYAEAISWLRDVLLYSVFTKERLEVLIAKELQNLPAQKRDGDQVAREWCNRLCFDVEKSTSEAASLLNQLEFIPRISEELKESPDKVIKAMETLIQKVVDPSVMRVNVHGDIKGLSEPRSTLAKAFLPVKEAVSLDPLSTSAATLTELGKAPSKKLVVVPMASIEGSYSSHAAKGPRGWDHPDVPALSVAQSVLNAMESYLWKSIRGAGLAYGAHVTIDQESGFVGFRVYRSPNAMTAFKEAGRIMRTIADGTMELDENVIDAAKASMVFAYAQKSETVGAAATTAYVDEVLKGIGKDWSQRMLAEIPQVTREDIRAAIGKYYVPLFDPATSIGAVTVNVGKADEVESGFKELGFETERHELPKLGADDSDMNGSEGSESGSESGSEGEPMEDVRSP